MTRLWFTEGLEAGSEPNLSQSIAEAGQDPERVIAVANSDAVAIAYEAATEEARRLNIFGAPTSIVDGEVFWGDDRLDDAIVWRRSGTLGHGPETNFQ
jgi:2-hydroxychromene-2-carboxylate isomerase